MQWVQYGHLAKKGWVLNTNAMYRKRKKELMAMLDVMDKNAESRGINAQEKERFKNS